MKPTLTTNKPVLRRYAGLTLLVSVVVLGIIRSTPAQSVSPEGRFTIPLSNLQSKPYDIRVRNKDGKARVELKAGGNKLMFVRIVESRENIKVSIEGQPESYSKDEPLNLGIWYPFKVSLPLVFTMRPDDKPQLGVLEIGELPSNIPLPKTMAAARRLEPGQIDRVSGLIGYRLTYDAQTLISVKPESLSLTIDESKGLQSTDNELLLEDMATGDSKGGWTFFRVKPQIQVGDFKVQVADVSGEATVAAGSPVEMSQWYGFKGGIKLRVSVQESQALHDEANVAAVLEVEAGRAQTAPQTPVEAIHATRDFAAIEPRGAIVEVQTIIKITLQPTWTDWVFGHLRLFMGLAAIGLAMSFLVLWLLETWKDKKWMRQQEKRRAPSDYDYDSPAVTPIVKSEQQGIGQKIFGKLKREAPEEDNERMKEQQRQALIQERGVKWPPAEEPAPVAAPTTYNRQPAKPNSPATPPAGPSVKTSPPVVPVVAPALPASNRDNGREMADLREKLQQLEDSVGSLRGASSGTSVPPAVKNYVNTAIEHFYKDTREREKEAILEESRKGVQQLKAEFIGRITELMQAIAKQFDLQNDKHSEHRHMAKEMIEALRHNQSSELASMRALIDSQNQLIEERLASLPLVPDAGSDEPSAHDRFYASLLGMIFGRSVEPLREEHFDKLIGDAGEMLNRFFKEGLPRPEALDELVGRATAIRGAVHAVVEVASGLAPAAKPLLLPSAADADRLAKELLTMNAQLRQRQVSLESYMHIPVSAYEGARYTFLEQLGLAIKREIDKLRDPHAYFEREWERLVTRDVPTIADVCDYEVASPGLKRELETALDDLFASAGLRCIMPKRGDVYQPAEQNISELVAGTPSQTVAGTVNRGFYYRAGSGERVLRKARVRVYR